MFDVKLFKMKLKLIEIILVYVVQLHETLELNCVSYSCGISMSHVGSIDVNLSCVKVVHPGDKIRLLHRTSGDSILGIGCV